jgi:hypothetical protein
MAIDPEELCPLPSPNVRAASYYIARTHIPCPHCGAITPLTAVALAPAHETLDDDAEEWQSVPANAFLFYLEAVSYVVHVRLREEAPNLCFDSYWANHCEHCERMLGDHEVHGEPGCGFTPLSEEQAANIVLTEIAEPFEALAAGYSLEPDFFARMRHG